jgi:hypothetical protein
VWRVGLMAGQIRTEEQATMWQEGLAAGQIRRRVRYCASELTPSPLSFLSDLPTRSACLPRLRGLPAARPPCRKAAVISYPTTLTNEPRLRPVVGGRAGGCDAVS